MIVSEVVAKTLGVCGLVGAGTIAINEITRKKKNNTKPLQETGTAEENNNVQECKVIPRTSFSVDSEKLEKMLVEASFPENKVKDFVAAIKEQAAPEQETVRAETVEDDTVKAASFTVIKEPKMTQPNFGKNNK